MKNLTTDEIKKVNGGTCTFDYNTELKLTSITNLASSNGLIGSSTYLYAIAETIAQATYINCNN